MGGSGLSIGWPVDSIIETDAHYVLGSYKYDGARSGRIHFLDKHSKRVARELTTSGTFCISEMNGLVYAANSQAISAYSMDGTAYEVATEHMNTYIDCRHCVAAADTGGCVTLYNSSLCRIKALHVSADSIWVSKEIDGRLYIGCEEGLAYEYDYEKDRLAPIGSRRSGILDFLAMDGLLYISSYDGNVEAHDLRAHGPQRRFEHTGSLWRMVRSGQAIHASCMYDGYRVFGLGFGLVDAVSTNSICYGLCVARQEVLWSSFYDNCIYWRENRCLSD